VNTFLDNAQRIFDVARTGGGAESSEFALLIRPDGGLHVIMEPPVTLEAAAIYAGASAAYHVSRSPGGVRVTGRACGQHCVLESGNNRRVGSELLRDQPLYRITSPLLISVAS
jgi:hypothetical protein